MARVAKLPRELRSRSVLVALLLLPLIVLVVLFDWNWLKGPIERRVERTTGREFTIEGDLDVDLGWTSTVELPSFRLASVPGATLPNMLTGRNVAVDVKVWPLLRGDLVIPRLRAERLDLVAERTPEGRANWVFPARDVEPDVAQLAIESGTLRLLDPTLETDATVNVKTGEPEPGLHAPLLIDGGGRFKSETFTIEGRVDSPLSLRDTDTPYHIDLRSRVGATRAVASGDLTSPLQLSGFDLLFELSGANLADLYPLVGLAIPDTPPYSVQGRLGYSGEIWSFTNFRGSVGDSDLGGHVKVDVRGERPIFVADLVSQQLDLDDLAGFIGAPVQIGPNETASAKQRKEALAKEASPKLLPDKPFDLGKLRAMDADVHLRAAQVIAPKMKVEWVDARLVVKDGVGRLDPFVFGVAGGRVGGKVAFDAKTDPIVSNAALYLRGLSLAKFIEDREMRELTTGRFGGDVAIQGAGNSVAAMLAHADGHIGLAMGRGKVSNLLMEKAGLDIWESLKYLIGKDKQIPIRCAYADFDVAKGVVRTEALAFDTTDTVIYGEGTTNLRTESIDLKLEPKPKDNSPIALRTPLEVGGTLKNPRFGPELGPLTLRAAATAALYALAPPAALLGVVETGPGEDTDCGGKTRLADVGAD